MIISAFIKGQSLTLPRAKIVAGSNDYHELRAIFQTGDWAELDVWAHFAQDGKNIFDAHLIDGYAGKDQHINLSAGEWQVYFTGHEVDGAMRITTNQQPLEVQKTGFVCGPFPDVPLTHAEQITKNAEEAKRLAKQAVDTVTDNLPLTERAEAAAKAAEAARDSAGGSMESAALSAQHAGRDAGQAATSAQQAEAAARAAEDAQNAAANSSGQAKTDAQAAAQSAASAGKSQSSAAASAGEAAASETVAKNSATAASKDAQSASADAQRASESAQNAKSDEQAGLRWSAEAAVSARDSKRAAESARASAETAKADAQTASGAAETATKKAQEATEAAAVAAANLDAFDRAENKNLYDNKNPTIVQGYFTANVFSGSPAFFTLLVPVEPDAFYCVSTDLLNGKFSVCTFATLDVQNLTPVEDGKSNVSSTIPNGEGAYAIVKATSETKAIGIYYYKNGNSAPEGEVRKHIRVDPGVLPLTPSRYTLSPSVDTAGIMIPSAVQGVNDVILPVSKNLVGDATPAAGWTGNSKMGYVHTPGNTDAIAFYAPFKPNTVFIAEFDTTYTGGEFCTLGFANLTRTICYNGSTHIVIPIKTGSAEERNLVLKPYENFAGTISNFICREVTPLGAEQATVKRESFSSTAENPENLGFWDVLIGGNNASKAISTTRSVVIGRNALAKLLNGHRLIGIGTFAMSQMTEGENDISIGADSMLSVKHAEDCIAIGRGALYTGNEMEHNIAIGRDAMASSGDVKTFYNVAIGSLASYKDKGHWNVAIGYQAGYKNTTGYGNVCIGFNTMGGAGCSENTVIGSRATCADNTYNSIAIGTQSKVTKSNQAVFGNANTRETRVFGNLIVTGTDGVQRKIIFNPDGAVTWEAI